MSSIHSRLLQEIDNGMHYPNCTIWLSPEEFGYLLSELTNMSCPTDVVGIKLHHREHTYNIEKGVLRPWYYAEFET